MRLNPFTRKKSDEDIAKEIDKLVKNLSLEKKLGILSYIICDHVAKQMKEPFTPILLDATILEILKRQYLPKGVLFHLSLIANKLVQDNPNVLTAMQVEETKDTERWIV